MKFTALEEYGLRCILHLAREDASRGDAPGSLPGSAAHAPLAPAEGKAAPTPAPADSGAAGTPESTSRPEARPVKAGSPGVSLTLGRIADEEGLTQQYAGKIFRILGRSGLVESERGRNGGYRLTRRPEEITVSEVLTALGGKFFDRKLCGRYRGAREVCVHTGKCAVRLLWLEVQRVVDQVLLRSTLRDLVLRERSLDDAIRNLREGVVTVAPLERTVTASAPAPGGEHPTAGDGTQPRARTRRLSVASGRSREAEC